MRLYACYRDKIFIGIGGEEHHLFALNKDRIMTKKLPKGYDIEDKNNYRVITDLDTFMTPDEIEYLTMGQVSIIESTMETADILLTKIHALKDIDMEILTEAVDVIKRVADSEIISIDYLADNIYTILDLLRRKYL